MLVALARKLAIALWRYVETGLVPQGAKSPRTTTAPHKPPEEPMEPTMI
jgi:hypothetical protein